MVPRRLRLDGRIRPEAVAAKFVPHALVPELVLLSRKAAASAGDFVWHDAGAIGQRWRFIPSRRVGTGTQARFAEYTASLASVLGHADRVGPFADYRIGLLSTEGRKSVEPLAAATAPERTAAQHQSLLHFLAQAPWSDQAMLRRVREAVLPSITGDEPIQAWIIDDTGFPKACPRA